MTIAREGYTSLHVNPVTFSSSEQSLNLQIALVPHIAELDFAYIRRINFWNAFQRALDILNPFLLILGTIVSFITMVLHPSFWNYGILTLYLVLDGVRISFVFRLLKPFGHVRDATNGTPLSLTVIRVFDQTKNILLATHATDESGKFQFLLAPGAYYITAVKLGFIPYHSGTIVITKSGLATLDVDLMPGTNLE